MTKLFSFDAETNGLQGQAFAIGAVVYESGTEVRTFYARCPIVGQIDGWVAENVFPKMEGMEVTHATYAEMLAAFASFYINDSEGATVLVHMGLPVEARLMLDMYAQGLIGPWDMPYPLIDVAGNLDQAGYDPTSVDAYNAAHGIQVPTAEAGGTHNPLYDSRAAALCYMHLKKK